MPGLSLSHILILLVVFLLVFGARRIPEIGASLGKGIREFKKSLREIEDEQPPVPPSAPPSSVPSARAGGEPKRLSQ